MTKYARDEFDKVPEALTRQGVHRAVSLPRQRNLRLGPILAVGFVALAVGLVAFLILPKLGFGTAGEASAQAVVVDSASASPAAASTQAPPAASPSATASAAAEAPGAAPSPEATAEAAPVAAPAVDKSQPVTIFNGTTTAGLAKRVGGVVSSAGWTLGSMGNWAGVAQQTSVIFYKGADQKANAESLGRLLGIPTTVQSAEFQVPLVVVLGPGFR